MNMTKLSRVLIVDDEPDLLANCQMILSREGYEVRTMTDSLHVEQAVSEFDPDLLITDLMIPNRDGMEVLRQIKWSRSDLPVVMMTAFATVETAVEAMKEGATDYVVKPFAREQLVHAVNRALKERHLLQENHRLRHELAQSKVSTSLIAVDPAMREVMQMLTRVADTEASVLIQGESGTGKEVLARALHQASRRNGSPFLAVNCGALPANLVESELFGHEKGSFTGASTSRKGMLEEAQGGTFFFDEITEMDLAMQSKLLRVIQERTVRRVGGNREIPLDVRIISATNRDPQEAVQQKLFREDLYFRVAVVTLHVPPLRERRDDIPALAHHFLKEIGEAYGRTLEGFTPQVLDMFANYEWPGNVRELRNVVERAISLAGKSVIREEDLPAHFHGISKHTPEVDAQLTYDIAKARLLDQFQTQYFSQLLSEEKGNISRVATRAGVDRKTVYRILNQVGLAKSPN
ncbi:MAG: sigma-54-dependent Fis family transcriptional regulator [Calditrichaeota bacterium]|nr:sigma-54-dependent Fis family transcriptional regulator [Calditrichota bacterium]MCB9391894.1 sigma-54-dependent Fis family transcriptional regulator [Calditrichota bacterium]